MMSGAFHDLSRSAWKLLCFLPIVCLMMASCSTTQNPPVSSQTLQCGTINPVLEGTVSAERTGSCFWQAFQHCQAASLTYINESSSMYVFTTKSNASQCQVVENVSLTKGTTKSSTYTCSKLQAFRGGNGALLFTGCNGNGKITVPINPSLQ